MLAIQPSSKSQKCTLNLLPARLNHNGPINDAEQYWKPIKKDEGKSQAYFRGRHLHGTTLTLPSNYTGTVLNVTEKDLARPQSRTNNDRMEADDEDKVEEKVEVKVAEKMGEFEEIVVWGHGEEVDKGSDMFVRGIEEWVEFAEVMHVNDEEEKGKKS